MQLNITKIDPKTFINRKKMIEPSSGACIGAWFGDGAGTSMSFGSCIGAGAGSNNGEFGA